MADDDDEPMEPENEEQEESVTEDIEDELSDDMVSDREEGFVVGYQEERDREQEEGV